MINLDIIMPNNYHLNYDNELDLYSIYNTKKQITYTLRPKEQGGFDYECKAISVYGIDFMCKHKLMIIERYYIKDERLKKMFRINTINNRFSRKEKKGA